MGRSKLNLLAQKIEELFKAFPDIEKLFAQIALPLLSSEMTLQEFFDSLADQFFRDSGFTKESLLALIKNIIAQKKENQEPSLPVLKSLTVSGSYDKAGNPENFSLELFPGDCYAVTGLTGSGKTQFLEDIEYIALGDSPSKRKILINGAFPSESERENLENRLCANLSQSMNFVMELSCEAFIKLHIECRKSFLSSSEKKSLVADVIECANSLAGEKIFADSVITQLSGGQSVP